jgi:outer membrane protein assembly factor BamD (BamD/ComL family)
MNMNMNKARRAHTVSPPLPATNATPAPEAELALLQRSQAALDREPGAALALAEQHAREHPAGVFSQEREMLAMEALVKLRRVPAALARAERFVRDYPTSPHNERVRALLERFRMLAPATIQRDRIHPMDVPDPNREP